MLATFHCATPALTKLEDELHHLCHYGRPLLLVFGPPGAGKSHLFARLKTTLAATLPVAAVPATPLLTGEQLDTDVLRQLGLHQLVATESDLALAIARAPVGRRVLLVDDAHDLHLSVLRSLLECAHAEREREDPRLSIVLFGDDMLHTALAELDYVGLTDDDCHRFQLPSFSAEETQRLATVWAAATGEAEPEKSTLRELWQRTQGWPGAFLASLELTRMRAVKAAEAAEADAALRAEARPLAVPAPDEDDGDDVQRPPRRGWWQLPLMVVGVFLLCLTLLYQGEINDWIKGAGKKPAPAADKAADAAPARIETVPEGRQSLALDTGEDSPAAQQPATAETDASAAAPGDTSAAREPGPVEDTLERQTAAGRRDLALSLPAETGTVASESGANTAPPASTAATPASASAPSPEKTPPAKSGPATKAASSQPPSGSQPATVASAAKPESKPAVTVPDAGTAGHSADEQALLSAAAGGYVVQLVALRDEATLQAFVRQHSLAGTRIYLTQRNGQPLRVLVLGPYASRDAAEAARLALPDAVRNQGAWLKSLAAVHKDIRAGG